MSTPEHDAEALLLHDGFVRGLAHGLLADAHAADDLAQDTWLAALERGGRAESLPRWLAGVVRHLAAKARRGEERRARRERDAARPEATPSTEEILEREAARARVVRAVLALGQPYREAVLLRYFEGLAPRAIARRLGLPVETVRTRLKRALALLRAALDREHSGERTSWSLALAPFARLSRTSLPLTSVLVMTLPAKLAIGAGAAVLAAVFFLRDPGPPAVTPSGDRIVPSAAPEEPSDPRLALPPPAVAPTRRALAAREEPVETIAGEPTGALLVRVTWWDGTPASDVHARIEPAWKGGDPTWRALAAVTDSEGELRVERLPSGRALVEIDRGDSEWAEIEAGAEATLAITLPRGFDVAGVVLDPAGRTVADAEIWLSYPYNQQEGNVVARTDAGGRFRVRSCTSGTLGARAARFAPSLLQTLRAAEGAELLLELVLLGPGGELAGTVLGPDGRAVPSALVLVGEPGKWRITATPAGGERPVTGTRPHPRESHTDDEGRYEVHGLAPGGQPVVVRATGFGLWRGEAQVLEHGRSILDVRLAPGVTLVGRVVDREGRPLDAQVRVGPRSGPFGSGTTTDEEGRFRLEDLEAGELEVLATHESTHASATLRGAPGETITWEAVLSEGGAIRGRLVDERGAPVAGWLVQVQDEPPFAPDYCRGVAPCRTDVRGHFVVEGLGEHRHRLEALDPQGSWWPSAVASGVVPEREEVLLRVDPALRPSARIRGVVVDASGRAVANASLWAVNPDFRRQLGAVTGADGGFELGPGPPGSWALRVSSPELADCPELRLGPRAIEAGATWDCGTIALRSGGTLLVRAAHPMHPVPSLVVQQEGSFRNSLHEEGAAWRSDPLAPGSYRLAVRGAGVDASLVPFEIHPGATSELEIPLVAGHPVAVKVLADAGGTRRQPVLRITGAGGSVRVEEELWLQSGGDYGLALALAPGSYEVEAWWPGGGRDAAQLAVGTEGAVAPVVLELR